MPEPLQPVLTIDPQEGGRPDQQQAQGLFAFITGPLREWLIEHDINQHFLKRLQVVAVGSEYLLVLERFESMPNARQVAVDSQGNPGSRIEVYLVDTAPPAMPGATK